jgi:hypothetical protein
MRVWVVFGLVAGMVSLARAAAPLPERTSRYNQGNAPGRYRNADGSLRHFALKRAAVPIYDGGAREICTADKPVLLNVGAFKEMKLDGAGRKQTFAWAWATKAGSGWIALDDLVDPPPVKTDPTRNPKPPGEAKRALTIDAARGRELLTGLRHVNSKGVLPTGGGNKGEHYAGRHPGPRDYVYLLFAVPNVQRGGVAKDSLPDRSHFIPALDEHGRPIAETMTMYRDDDLDQPVPVTFLYGRAEDGQTWGWLARANVGER